MNAVPSFGARCAVIVLITVMPGLAGCFSLGSPAVPVRWFDPLSSLSAADGAADGAADADRAAEPATGSAVRVVAADHLRQEFTVRIAAHEVAFDGDHRWLLMPRDLVAEALRRAGVRGDGGPGDVVVHVDAFEFDRVSAPFARIRLRLHGASTAGPDQVVVVRVAASDATPQALVQAMAEALPQAAAEVAIRLAAPGPAGRADGS